MAEPGVLGMASAVRGWYQRVLQHENATILVLLVICQSESYGLPLSVLPLGTSDSNGQSCWSQLEARCPADTSHNGWADPVTLVMLHSAGVGVHPAPIGSGQRCWCETPELNQNISLLQEDLRGLPLFRT